MDIQYEEGEEIMADVMVEAEETAVADVPVEDDSEVFPISRGIFTWIFNPVLCHPPSFSKSDSFDSGSRLLPNMSRQTTMEKWGEFENI